MLNAIVIGDLHLNRLDRIFPNGTELQLRHVKSILDYGLSVGVKTFIFTGDIGHYSNLTEEASHGLYQLVVEYEGLGASMHFIPGNHDHKKIGKNSLKFFQLLTRHNSIASSFYEVETVVTIDGVKVVFLPYPITTTKQKNAVVVGHFSTKGAMRDNNTRMPGKHTPDSNFYVLGHLHTYQEGANYLFVGTPYQTNWSESIERSVSHLKAKSASVVKHKRVFLPTTFELRQANVGDAIENAEHIRYRLHTTIKDTVPSDFLVNNPSVIVQHTSPATHKFDDFNLKFGLKEFLRAKGLSLEQMKRAKTYVDLALQENGL